MKAQMSKKILSVFLTLLLICSIVPLGAITASAATYDANKVVNLALSKVGTSYANGYCLSFVKEMFQSAYGFTSTACCAYKYGSTYLDSSSRKNIPLGASVFFAGSSKTCSTCKNRCGHIGIYVGNDYVVHAWGGKIVKYKIDRIINAGYPYRGWGWHGNHELSSDFGSGTEYSTNPNDYTVPTRDIFYKSPVMTGNDVAWIQAVLYQLGYKIVVDGSFGPATRDVVKKFQSDNGLTVDGSVGPATRAKLKDKWQNNSYTVTLHAWFSDSAMGDTPERYLAGKTTYLCYELYRTDTGELLDKLSNYNYTAQMKIMGPDGATEFSYSYNNDSNWIAITRSKAGTYKGNVTISGALSVSVNCSFVLDYDANLSSSESSVSLNLNGVNSKTSTFTASGALPGNYGIHYSVADPSIVSCSWNGWSGSSNKLIITGLKRGTTTITVSLYENYTGNKEIIASYKIPVTVTSNLYTVSYNANGGIGAPSSQTKYYNESLIISSVKPTRVGYNFVGWSTSSTATGATYSAGDVYTNNNSVTLYAVWKADTLRVAFNANGGVVDTTSKTVENGSEIGTLPTATRTGYTFDGWYTASGTKVTASTVVTADVTYYAHWTSKNINITFNGNGATGGSTAAQTYTYGTAQSLKANGFSRSYTVSYNANGGSVSTSSNTATYTFSKWNNAANGSGAYSYNNQQSVTNPCGSTGSNVTLYAQWNSASVTLPTPTRAGYTFAGWYTASSGGTRVGGAGSSYTPSSSVTLYAHWNEEAPYTVSFNANGGTASSTSKSVGRNTAVGTLPTATRTGYTFDGWYTASGTKVTASTVVTADVTYYAHWIKIPVAEGISVSLPSSLNMNYKNSATLTPTVSADAEYTMKWESSNEKVAKVSDNGKVTATGTGSATITCTVTDINGKTVFDTCDVNVEYSFGQWLIIILLFGWIWYI